MNTWKQSSLLLVGHGSSRTTASRAATCRLAEALSRLALFAEVRACFWKEEPFLSLDLVTGPQVFVVPNFAGEGIYTRKLIPERLGLSGIVTERSDQRIVYTRPVGSHPMIPQLLIRRAEALCQAAGIDPTEVALLIIGHGSSHPRASTGTPESVAEAVRQSGRFGEVTTAYIEQAPHVADWPRLVSQRFVIAAPLLISEGMHASKDLPPLFGLDLPEGGPVSLENRLVWLMGGIGRDPEVAEIILDLVRSALP